jgi:ligand-binding SRPBCC domain-containing protein
MKINIATPGQTSASEVMKNIEQELFEALSPPGAGVEIVRFDGSKKGDIVHIRLSLLGFIKQDWISEIVEAGENEEEIYFVDEGKQLPFFLRFWRHRHRVQKAGSGAVIIDDIEFKSPLWLPGFLLYPVLYLQFAYRKPIYRRFFG